MNFERGRDVKKTIGVGMSSYSPWNYPEEDTKILIRFRLRKSCPEYYPLQRKEKRGIAIVAISRGKWVPNDLSTLVCKIPECEDQDYFFAEWNEEEKLWEIS